jgi:hypothetical protein
MEGSKKREVRTSEIELFQLDFEAMAKRHRSEVSWRAPVVVGAETLVSLGFVREDVEQQKSLESLGQ